MAIDLEQAPHVAPKPSKKKRSWPIVVMTMLVIAACGLVAWWAWPTQEAAPVPEHEFNTSSPSTFKDSTLKKAKAAAPAGEDPLFTSDGAEVAVPSLGINSPIKSEGTYAKRYTDGRVGDALILPEPPFAAWFNETAEIGSDEGNALIASHVDHGQGTLAPFSALSKIEKGTPVFVRGLDGKIYTYRASSIEVYARQEIPKDTFRVGGDPHLVLVTCSGPYVGAGRGAFGYLYNLVVVADPDTSVPQGVASAEDALKAITG